MTKRKNIFILTLFVFLAVSQTLQAGPIGSETPKINIAETLASQATIKSTCKSISATVASVENLLTNNLTTYTSQKIEDMCSFLEQNEAFITEYCVGSNAVTYSSGISMYCYFK